MSRSVVICIATLAANLAQAMPLAPMGQTAYYAIRRSDEKGSPTVGGRIDKMVSETSDGKTRVEEIFISLTNAKGVQETSLYTNYFAYDQWEGYVQSTCLDNDCSPKGDGQAIPSAKVEKIWARVSGFGCVPVSHAIYASGSERVDMWSVPKTAGKAAALATVQLQYRKASDGVVLERHSLYQLVDKTGTKTPISFKLGVTDCE
jgi:hypothetical protein